MNTSKMSFLLTEYEDISYFTTPYGVSCADDLRLITPLTLRGCSYSIQLLDLSFFMCEVVCN